MSRRRDIDTRLASLRDIGKIMGSLKNLSYMETRKLARFLDSQRRVVTCIESAARDFLAHDPRLLERPRGEGTLFLLIGAERGFCGDFNGSVLRALDRLRSRGDAGPSALVAVGTRLGPLLEGDPTLARALPGASAAEEVPAVLSRLVETLNRVGAERGLPSLVVVHWDAETEVVESVSLLPPFRGAVSAGPPAHASAPCLNLSPEAFLSALIEQYLFAALHGLVYGSLMAEHQQRVRQLGGALERIDARVHELEQRRNLIRQEEITEEIELILLNLPDLERRRAVTQTHE
jgi:F-type H+-transporting ATPase subunit gamma